MAPSSLPIATLTPPDVDIIRKLIRHPLGFASCGNDGFVKVWTAGPPMSCILSVLAHPAAADIDSFVYSIAYIESTGSIVSVGEDRYARIIAGDGTIVQSIKHPAAVRDVDVLPNSDIVTACSDGAIRVWSRSSERHADDSTRNAYHELLAVTETAAMQTLDPSQLRPASVLQAAGEHPGQVVIVDLPNKGPTVFQWDQDASTWQEVGAALGAASKPTLDGVQYDHVTYLNYHCPLSVTPVCRSWTLSLAKVLLRSSLALTSPTIRLQLLVPSVPDMVLEKTYCHRLSII